MINDNMSLNRSRQTGKFYMGGKSDKIIVPQDEFLNEISEINKQNEQEKKEKEIADRLKEAHDLKQKEIEERLEGLEIVPNGNKLILMPYASNPYIKVMEGGIYVAPSGMFYNPDTGEMDYQKDLVSCGQVVEVGPDVKYLKPGDDVYYDSRTAYPLPFMSLGYQITSEPQIIAIINNDLKKRLNV